MDKSGLGKTVCVTGASGYIGSHIVKQLLDKGYTVRGTVRNADDMGKYSWLKELEVGSPGKLELVSADLTVPGSFDKAVESCEFVCHVAATVQMAAKDPKKEILDPTVEGTRDLFQSIIKAGTAKRVVLTSSVAAITDPVEKVFSEEDWHTDLTLNVPYSMAKTLEEKLAWKIYDEQKSKGGWSFELVAIHPVFVFGEFFNDQHGKRGSAHAITQLMDGSLPLVPDFNLSIVHVRDVALAHVLAMENPEAKGRYIVSNEGFLPFLDVAGVIKKQYPHCKLPTMVMPTMLLYAVALVSPTMSFEWVKRMAGSRQSFTNKKAVSELGIDFISAEQAILDTAKCLLERGLVPEPVLSPPRTFPFSLPFNLFSTEKKSSGGVPTQEIQKPKESLPEKSSISVSA